MGVEAFAGRGQPDRALPSLEQRHPELVLELRDVVRHHRLRVVEREGGAGERAMLRNLVEDREPPQIHHRQTQY